jgi:hypothetical protein
MPKLKIITWVVVIYKGQINGIPDTFPFKNWNEGESLNLFPFGRKKHNW